MVLDASKHDSNSKPALRPRLTRACTKCIKAKRKCTYELPVCHRCQTRNFKCIYENEPLGQSPVYRKALSTRQKNGNLDGIQQQRRRQQQQQQQRQSSSSTSLTIYHPLAPTYIVPIDPDTIKYMTKVAKGHLFMFGLFGGTLFIHRDLSKSQLMRNVQVLSRACSSQALLPQNRSDMIAKEIEYSLNSIMFSTNSVLRIEDILTSVQCLMLIRIMTMFVLHLDPERRACVEQRQHRMQEIWMEKLWISAPRHLPGTMSLREAFLLAESVRRTMIVGAEIRGLYDARRQGWIEHSLFSHSLPFERRTGLWDLETEEEFNVAFRRNGYDDGDTTTCGKQQMISWREFADTIDTGNVAEKYTPFETMLLVGAKGKPTVEKVLQREI